MLVYIPFFYEAWRYSPPMYIICKGDKSLPEDAQRGVVENARNEGADVTVFECEGIAFGLFEHSGQGS